MPLEPQLGVPAMSVGRESKRLSQLIALDRARIIKSELDHQIDSGEQPVLVVLAAGKGTRFGVDPKCVQPVDGKPLARHSIEAFGALSPNPAICLVGYRAEQVARALGDDNIHVLSRDPGGGTAWAAYESFCVDSLAAHNPIVVVSMGDRIVPPEIFDRLLQTHRKDAEADLTILTANYSSPMHHGKGRIVRDANGCIQRIVEQRDIDVLPPGPQRDQLQRQPEGNCPLYAIRARTLKKHLGDVSSDNAQNQFYFTDIVEAIYEEDGVVRSITVDASDRAYPLLCADVTSPRDLPALESVYRKYQALTACNGRER